VIITSSFGTSPPASFCELFWDIPDQSDAASASSNLKTRVAGVAEAGVGRLMANSRRVRLPEDLDLTRH
jgi:hypothetical protein